MRYWLYRIKRFFKILFGRRTIYYSKSGNWYYILEQAQIGSYWLSTKKYKTKPEIRRVFEGLLEITPKNEGRYYRILRPFVFWKIKSGKREVIDGADELVLDYGNGLKY